MTLAEALKQTGYKTFHGGKWHLGPEGFWPEDQGFDVNKGGIGKGGPYGGKRYFSPYDNPRLPDGPEGEHLPDRIATKAIKFIEMHRRDPFFVYVPFYDVHTPLMAREDLRRKYEAKRQKLGLQPKFGAEPPRRVREVQEDPVYAGMVEAMDLAVGKVLAALDRFGSSTNTIVIFTSDNGGLSTSEGSPTSNLPLRAGKGWLYEGGIRVPLIVRWPTSVKAGAVENTPVTSPDFYPTLLAAAGVTAQPHRPRDGISLLGVLTRTKPAPARPIFWHYPHYGNQGGAPGAAVRLDKWKLIEWFDDDRVELFNLADDLSETNNVADTNPEVVRELRLRLRSWQKEVGALPTTSNPSFRLEARNGRLSANGAENFRRTSEL